MKFAKILQLAFKIASIIWTFRNELKKEFSDDKKLILKVLEELKKETEP